MFRQKFLIPVLVAVAAFGTSIGIAASDVSLEGVKCLMVGKKDAKADKSAKWKDGKVYFCCDGCCKKFDKMDDKAKEKLAAKANHQLVATKQYVQEGCPFSGGKVKDGTEVKVAGAEVKFCCKNCKAKAEKMKGDEQIAKLFGEKAFKKAKFKVAKKDDK